MGFWDLPHIDQQVVVTPKRSYTYRELNEAIRTRENMIQSDQKQLILLLCQNEYDLLVTYLATLRTGHAAMLVSADLDQALLHEIIYTYQPAWIYGSYSISGYEQIESSLWRKIAPTTVHIHPDLAVLLSTSGTTGSRKFVRLSYNNIQSNAEAIADYLQLKSDERGVVNLPISYSYGLSIINSHLEAGAAILLTDESVMSKSFWTFIDEQKATSFAGVPFTYQMLQRIGFLKMELPFLRSFTQAGGRLDERLVRLFGEYAKEHHKQFYVMYGQTEASPRMSYIPPEQLLEKSASIGITIPGGSFELDSETNELIYKGPNVMMGYAETLDDLGKADELHGILHTGDTAEVDQDGFYSITGRLKRFIKLFGLRINLDEVEKRLEKDTHAAVACTGNDDRLIVVVESESIKPAVQECLDSVYKLHKTAFRIRVVEAIPRMKNGKVDYVAIKEGL